VRSETPKQFPVAWDSKTSRRQTGSGATLLPDDEILVGFTGDEGKRWITRSRDYGLTWDGPTEGRVGYYLKSRRELWSISWEHRPSVIWRDRATNFDELNTNNFWSALSRSRDLGRTWSEPAKLNLPFPAGRAYAPIKGRAGAVLFADGGTVRELSDGSIG